MPSNPMLDPIRRFLHKASEPVTEHALIKALPFCDEALSTQPHEDANLLLFRKHFLVMNALYTLQAEFWAQGWRLNISPLAICLTHADISAEQASQTLPLSDGEQAVREYYLDWSEFSQSTADSVEALLQGFYDRDRRQDDRQHALNTLELEPDASLAQIRARYRRLAALHHPDRGGNNEDFHQIRHAYEVLSR